METMDPRDMTPRQIAEALGMVGAVTVYWMGNGFISPPDGKAVGWGSPADFTRLVEQRKHQEIQKTDPDLLADDIAELQNVISREKISDRFDRRTESSKLSYIGLAERIARLVVEGVRPSWESKPTDAPLRGFAPPQAIKEAETDADNLFADIEKARRQLPNMTQEPKSLLASIGWRIARGILLPEWKQPVKPAAPQEDPPLFQNTIQSFVLESNKPKGWKVAISRVPYGELHPGNMIVIKDGLSKEQAVAISADWDRRNNTQEDPPLTVAEVAQWLDKHAGAGDITRRDAEYERVMAATIRDSVVEQIVRGGGNG